MGLGIARHLPPNELERVFGARGWLSEHPPHVRAELLAMVVNIAVPAGAAIFREGDDASGLYGIVSGAIGVEGGHKYQTPMLGHVMRPGEWFGIRAVLIGGHRQLTYRAIEPSRLVILPSSRLVPMMMADPDIAIRVGQLGEIGSRLGSWIVRDLLTPDAGHRLAAVLYRALGMGELEPDDPRGFWLTQRQLGEMANLSRHHVARKLAQFSAAGWIACRYNRIRLLDPAGLAAFAYGDD